MPAIVIHALSRSAHKVTVEDPPIRIGRDPSNHVVLPDDTVSRDHAAFVRLPDGNWRVNCISETNPIVVEGKIVTDGAVVTEGTEILVGENHLLIFSENEFKADRYVGTKTFAKSECGRCKWQGIVSTAREPVCPRCAGTDFTPLDGYRTGVASGNQNAPTSQLDPEAAQQMFKKLVAAKRSYLERLEGRAGSGPQIDVHEDKPVEIGRGIQHPRGLAGFVFGRMTVTWNGGAFVAESAISFPSMRINGAKCRSALLRNGDIIEVGSNRFRFISGDGAGSERD